MNDLMERIAKEGRITDDLRQEIRSTFGSRGERALAAIDERRVKQFLDFTVVMSSLKEYVVEDDICTCGDFLFRGRVCWHILAVRLAAATGNFVVEDSWYQENWKKDE